MKIFQFRALVMLYTLAASVVLPCTAAAHDFQAVLDWAEKYIVNFQVNGSVEQVHVRVGDRVTGGTHLIELDTTPFDIRLRQFEAAVAAREPVLAEAKREYEQAGSLYEQTVLSDVELQRAQHAFEQARAELVEAQATLQLAHWRLDQASAVAPWDARVIQRSVEPGQVLVDEQRTTPLLVLARDGEMTARALLPAEAIHALHIGQKVSVLIDNNRRDADITSLGMLPETVDGESRYRLDARFDTTKEDDFRAGQAARIQLP
jgi:RND family efflux transporter MFP subunit